MDEHGSRDEAREVIAEVLRRLRTPLGTVPPAPSKNQEKSITNQGINDQHQGIKESIDGVSRLGEDGVARLGEDGLVQAIRAVVHQGPTHAWEKIERAILEHCPEMQRSWLPSRVGELVDAGLFPESDVKKILAAFRQRLRAPHLGPVRNQAAYLATLFKQGLARHGLQWKKPA